MKTASYVALAAALALFAGCAEMRWTKPGADNAAVSRDLDECRGLALRGAPQPPAAPGADPQVPVDRGAVSPGTRAVTGSSNERFVAEAEQTRVCMMRRGYQLERAN